MYLLDPRKVELATAEILYRMPDHPLLLQAYIWQELDEPPRFPVLKGFLDFWEAKLDGKLHSVKVTSSGLFVAEFKHVDFLARIH
ncbi:MAG: hypothetical protein A2854_01270 [Parcubacteria group bacterium RIFCSPHIGHO2_01_FULL_56_18]|nr:MAG: hypothetical protein A2854_01270 [Parcubacteria group bacterium RIFCSPHIGHO2_01_FULL_56_18]